MSDEITGSVSTEADSLSQPDAHERFATLVIVSMNTLHWVRFAYLEMQDSGLLTLRRLTTSMAINFSDDQLINMPDPVLATCTMVENEMLSTASAREHLERLEKVDSQQGAVLAAIHVCKKLEGMRKLLHAVFRMVETLWQEYSSITGDVLKMPMPMPKLEPVIRRENCVTMPATSRRRILPPTDIDLTFVDQLRKKDQVDKFEYIEGLTHSLCELVAEIENLSTHWHRVSDRIEAIRQHFGEAATPGNENLMLLQAWDELVGVSPIRPRVEWAAERYLYVSWWPACQRILKIQEVLGALAEHISDGIIELEASTETVEMASNMSGVEPQAINLTTSGANQSTREPTNGRANVGEVIDSPGSTLEPNALKLPTRIDLSATEQENHAGATDLSMGDDGLGDDGMSDDGIISTVAVRKAERTIGAWIRDHNREAEIYGWRKWEPWNT